MRVGWKYDKEAQLSPISVRRFWSGHCRSARVLTIAVATIALIAMSAASAPASALRVTAQWIGPTYAESGALPPDPNGAVGPTQVMVVANGRFKLYDKAGNPSGSLNVTDAEFFSKVSGGAATSTPHVRYDRLSGRWFVTEITLTSTSNRILIAVSSGPTIADTSSFTFYQFQHDLVGATPNMDAGHFASDASLAVDANALYIGVNEYDVLGGTKQNTTGYVINKADLFSGTLTVTAFRGLSVGDGAGPWTPVGVDNDDPAATEGYFIGASNEPLDHRLMIRRVSTPGGAPSISANISLTVPPSTFASFLRPPSPQPIGSGSPLDTLDLRLFAATITTNKMTGVHSLWTAHNSGEGSRWYQIDNLGTSPTLTQSGTVFYAYESCDPLIHRMCSHFFYYYWMPSITANGQGLAAVGHNSVTSRDFPGCANCPLYSIPTVSVSSRVSSDPAGTMPQPEIGLSAQGAMYNVDSGPTQRWGAYSQTVVDPTDDQTIWTFQEHVNADNSWGVLVLKLQAPPPAEIYRASRTVVARGLTAVDVTIIGTSGGTTAAFFDPGPGYTGRLTASVTGGVIVNSVTLLDPLRVMLNISVAGAADGPKDVTITNPDGQQTTKTAAFVVGPATQSTDFNGDGKADLGVFSANGMIWTVAGTASRSWGLAPDDIPVPGDYNGDRRAEFAVFSPGAGTWHIEGSSDVQWGQPGDIPVPGDYDGDGRTDIAVWRPSNGYWYVRNVMYMEWGQPGDIPVPADYDGDGTIDLAVWRPSNGTWYVRGGTTEIWGQAGDIPVPADYDGDGRADLAVYRPSALAGGPWWYVRGVGSWTIGSVGDMPVPQDLDDDGRAELVVYRPSAGVYYSYFWTTDTWQTTTAAAAQVPLALPVALRKGVGGDADRDRRRDPTIYRLSTGDWWVLKSGGGSLNVQWGSLAGDVPVAGDFDGDGVVDTGIFRPADGYWWMLFSASGYTTYQGVQWGISGDAPIVGDFDGDGKADLTVYRPSNGYFYARLSSTGYQTFRSWGWGIGGDVPVVGDFDGDGITDITVYRPSNGTWWSLLSSKSFSVPAYRSWTWGSGDALPVAGDYDGDGVTDIAVYYPSTGTWYALLSSTGFTTFNYWTWGLSTDVPIVGDFDGDGKADITVYRPSNGTWYSLVSGTGYTFQYWIWGVSGDIPVPGSPSQTGTSTTIAIVGSSGSQAFTPNPAAAPTGGVVKWHNSDALTHRIVLDDNSYDSGNLAPRSDRGGLAVGAVGKTYECSIHPSMVDTITASP